AGARDQEGAGAARGRAACARDQEGADAACARDQEGADAAGSCSFSSSSCAGGGGGGSSERGREAEEGAAEEVRAGRWPAAAAERDADLGVGAGRLRRGALHARVRRGGRHEAGQGPARGVHQPRGARGGDADDGRHADPRGGRLHAAARDVVGCASGANFTPHILNVATGEDINMKVISFSQQGPRAICILSANGVISNVTLRQHDSLGGTVTYEGRFELLSLSGSFTPTEKGGSRDRCGGMSVSLAAADGRVIGGGVAGLLVAASPVQVVVGSFLPSYQMEQNGKKPVIEMKTVAAQPAMGFTISSG
uniref:AT-hook motif nuclear-localized protein n=1 Tax=Aegilops tauschii subsp. strangulata TaxID=200361 RepID=A0A453N3B1_AEGTS